MKANYRTYNRTQLENQIHKESVAVAEQYRDLIFEAEKQNIGNQIAAVFFYVLHKNYKFSKVKLHNLKDRVEALFYAMDVGVFGQELCANDYVKFCKDELGIDLEDSKAKEEV